MPGEMLHVQLQQWFVIPLKVRKHATNSCANCSILSDLEGVMDYPKDPNGPKELNFMSNPHYACLTPRCEVEKNAQEIHNSDLCWLVYHGCRGASEMDSMQNPVNYT